MVLLVAAMVAASCAGEREAAKGATGGDSPAPVAIGSTPPLEPATVEQVQALIQAPGARATVVNVWASWCMPCRDEFPDLMQLHAAYRDSGLRLLLVSADFDDQRDDARQFLASQGVNFITYLKQGDDNQFINTMHPRWSGALPATLVYDGAGRLQYFHEGRFVRAELEAAMIGALRPIALPTGG